MSYFEDKKQKLATENKFTLDLSQKLDRMQFPSGVNGDLQHDGVRGQRMAMLIGRNFSAIDKDGNGIIKGNEIDAILPRVESSEMRAALLSLKKHLGDISRFSDDQPFFETGVSRSDMTAFKRRGEDLQTASLADMKISKWDSFWGTKKYFKQKQMAVVGDAAVYATTKEKLPTMSLEQIADISQPLDQSVFPKDRYGHMAYISARGYRMLTLIENRFSEFDNNKDGVLDKDDYLHQLNDKTKRPTEEEAAIASMMVNDKNLYFATGATTEQQGITLNQVQQMKQIVANGFAMAQGKEVDISGEDTVLVGQVYEATRDMLKVENNLSEGRYALAGTNGRQSFGR